MQTVEELTHPVHLGAHKEEFWLFVCLLIFFTDGRWGLIFFYYHTLNLQAPLSPQRSVHVSSQ